jgi:hypothetical protein
MSANDKLRDEGDVAREPVPEFSRRGSWPIAFVIAALIALAVIPTAMSWQVSRERSDLRNTTRPARTWLARVHFSLAMAATAVRNYLVTGDTAQIRAYEKARADEERAYLLLQPLLARLGDSVSNQFEALRQMSKAWHELTRALCVVTTKTDNPNFCAANASRALWSAPRSWTRRSHAKPHDVRTHSCDASVRRCSSRTVRSW